jgi:hypothetical protein
VHGKPLLRIQALTGYCVRIFDTPLSHLSDKALRLLNATGGQPHFAFFHHFLVLELRERLVIKGFPQLNA